MKYFNETNLLRTNLPFMNESAMQELKEYIESGNLPELDFWKEFYELNESRLPFNFEQYNRGGIWRSVGRYYGTDILIAKDLSMFTFRENFFTELGKQVYNAKIYNKDYPSQFDEFLLIPYFVMSTFRRGLISLDYLRNFNNNSIDESLYSMIRDNETFIQICTQTGNSIVNTNSLFLNDSKLLRTDSVE